MKSFENGIKIRQQFAIEQFGLQYKMGLIHPNSHDTERFSKTFKCNIHTTLIGINAPIRIKIESVMKID